MTITPPGISILIVTCHLHGNPGLGRAELVLRIDRTFKVRLPDHLIAA